ncbi:MAG TPA: hypothetical protein VL443_06340 [Cyclobacteriaceae bacterium]|jgi:predicted HicB family RNase H-like nuclease|nr:hypothetical protein [Cyclobacteriaceae bacterium]
MIKENEVKMIVAITKQTHKEIKKRAIDEGVSLKEWVREALAEHIKRKIELGWK